ncbi:MAG: RimK family alpha-L-glutamate ligase, partial [Clostridia bacterium]
LLKIVENIGVKPMLFQELIVSSYGRDIRVEVVGGKVVASVMRVASEGEFIANVTHGGKMFPYVLSEAEIELAINASKALQLDFAGIDILFGENNIPLLCEVNTNAHFKNLLLATGINVADAIVEYVLGTI